MTGSNDNTCRTFASAVLATSIGCHFGIIPIQWFYFHYHEIFKLPPEIWRFVTSFLLTGPKLGIVMDTYFVFQYLSQLETAHPKFNRREDLLWYVVFCGFVIVVSLDTNPHPPPSLRHYLPCARFSCTSHICPDSALLLLLSRFLKTRKITPALRPVRHSQYLV